ncbi:MAG: alpha/beta hydrolase [Sphingomonas bacterium]|nr:alpha/beta hydrolase [Sphingomonas bacterium]
MAGPLHPELQALLDRRAALGLPGFATGTPCDARATFANAQAALPPDRGAAVAAMSDFTIDGPRGPIPARRYVPHGEVTGRIVYFHGGGWVFGTLDGFDPICRELAASAGAEVLSVDYRLAPEFPYPAPLDDAFAAIIALAEPSVPLAVAGDSAGGNLAAAVALRARDEGGPSLRLQLLMYPVLDADFERDSYRRFGGGDYLISRADMAWFWDHHAPDVARDDSLLAPLRSTNLTGLPETIVVLAGCDPLHDEGLAYAEALRAAGVPVTVEDHGDMAHGFCTLIDLITPANDTVCRVGKMVGERLRT